MIGATHGKKQPHGVKDSVIITEQFANNVWTAPADGILTVCLEPAATTICILRYTRNGSQQRGLCVNSISGAIATGTMPVHKGDAIKRVYTSNVQTETITFDEFE
ncbi:hypothetical protein [Mobilibacterium timonense]|uniref:hypothetical protein n=1 Tax=Mobilibacterium timonense TaxID=1871012 RepID=UPI0009854733|nr:hypothetical protein [Mobilibacterium timonense]